jgi:hypothetical protein
MKLNPRKCEMKTGKVAPKLGKCYAGILIFL